MCPWRASVGAVLPQLRRSCDTLQRSRGLFYFGLTNCGVERRCRDTQARASQNPRLHLRCMSIETERLPHARRSCRARPAQHHVHDRRTGERVRPDDARHPLPFSQFMDHLAGGAQVHRLKSGPSRRGARLGRGEVPQGYWLFRFTACSNGPMMSSGSGKTIVEFLSAAMTVSVSR